MTTRSRRLSWPTINLEYYLSQRGYKYIVGIDEVGRGSIAGPVVVAAFVFELSIPRLWPKDSKLLTAKQRDKIFKYYSKLFQISYGVIDNTFVDRHGIRRAVYEAMMLAYYGLPVKPDILLIDGDKRTVILPPIRSKLIMQGDAKIFSIAAASIMAKVKRDRIMDKLAVEYPLYEWHKNKGYGTKRHIEAVKLYGLTRYHRKSYCKFISV